MITGHSWLSKVARGVASVAIFLLAQFSSSLATGDPSLGLIEDAAGMFNERGYFKSNSVTSDGNAAINDFNGNLIYTKVLKDWPISQGSFHATLKLTYNGSVGHRIVTGYMGQCSSDEIRGANLNAPEWILSLNDVAIQTFNFENEWYSWATGDTFTADTNSKMWDVAMLINGYHDCEGHQPDPEGIYHSVISIMMGDGSVKQFTSLSTQTLPNSSLHLVGGDYSTYSRDDQSRGYLDSSGYFYMLNPDGSRIKFKGHRPRWYSTLSSGNAPEEMDSLWMFLPIEFTDNCGNSITVGYDTEYLLGEWPNLTGEKVFGRPYVSYIIMSGIWCDFDWGAQVLKSAGNELVINTSDDEHICTIRYLHSNQYYASSSTDQNWAYITSITDAANRTESYAYKSYSRVGNGVGGCLPWRTLASGGPAFLWYTGVNFEALLWRLWTVSSPDGGRQMFTYYGDGFTKWHPTTPYDDLSVDFDNLCDENHLDKYPCKKSPAFDTLGRDPYFTNMVVAKRRYTVTGSDTSVISFDSIRYSWADVSSTGYIDTADTFYTEHYVADSSLNYWPGWDHNVNVSKFAYVMYPELSTCFWNKSRDAGWSTRLLRRCDGVEEDLCQSELRQTWSGIGRLLTSSTAIRDSVSATSTYSYDFSSGANTCTSNLQNYKSATDPWGNITKTYFNTTFHGSIASRYKKYLGMLADSVIVKDKHDSLLSKSTTTYWGVTDGQSDTTGGKCGQVKQSRSYDIRDAAITGYIDQYYYYDVSSIGPLGGLRKQVNAVGDSTIFDYGEGSAVQNPNAVSYRKIDQDSNQTNVSTRFRSLASPYKTIAYATSKCDTVVDTDTIPYNDTTLVEAASYGNEGTDSRTDTISVAQTVSYQLILTGVGCHMDGYSRIKKNGQVIRELECAEYDQHAYGSFQAALNDIVQVETDHHYYKGWAIAWFKHYDTATVIQTDTSLIIDSICTYSDRDAEGKLISWVDANGYASSLAYDTLDRVKEITLPYGYRQYQDTVLPAHYDTILAYPEFDAQQDESNCFDSLLEVSYHWYTNQNPPPPMRGTVRSAYLSFEVLSLADAAIDSAYLTFYAALISTEGSPADFTIRSASNGSPVGCGGTYYPKDPVIDVTIGETWQSHRVNVQSIVDKWAADQSYRPALVLYSSATEDWAHYKLYSRDHPDSTKWPKLEIYYHSQDTIKSDSVHSILFTYDDKLDDGDGIDVTSHARVTEVKGNSKASRSRFDGFGRAVQHDALDTNVASYDSTMTGYDFADRTIASIDQNKDTSAVFTYDNLDRNVSTAFTYDTSSTPDRNHDQSKTFSHTLTGNLGFPAGFNFANNDLYVTQSTDEDGKSVYEYADVMGRVRLRKVDTLKTFFDYDDLGNLRTVIKPKGDSVNYRYNSLGQLLMEFANDYDTIRYVYDKAGNLIAKQDGLLKAQSTTSTKYWVYNKYDGLNRLTVSGKMRIINNDTTRYPSNLYFYDQPTSANSRGRLSLNYSTQYGYKYGERFDYDARGRISKQVNYFNAVLDSGQVNMRWQYHLHGDSFVVAYTYNFADQVTSVTYPDGMKVAYSYDQRGRLWKVGDSATAARYATLTYTKRNETDQMVLDSGLQTIDYEYNGRGWLTNINDPLSLGSDKFGEWLRYHGDTVSYPAYFNGNIGGQRLKIAGETEENHHYRYDKLDRLFKDSIPGSSGYLHEVFTYDANGNRSTYQYRPTFGSNTTVYAYYYSGRLTGGNQIDSLRKDGLKNNSYTHDANGNLSYNLTKQLASYYDIYNQLDTVTKANGALDPNVLSFGYSVGGERVWKRYWYCWQDTCRNDTVIEIEEPPDGMIGYLPENLVLIGDSLGGMQTNGTTPPGGEPSICTFYDTVLTWYIVSNGKVLAEYDGLTKQLHYKYIYAGDQRIAMRDGQNRLHYYLNDHLGSARVVIDSAGTIKDKYHYLAFGSPQDVTTGTGQPNKYTGKPYDTDAGMNLYYYGARYYDGDGRFTQIDPLRNMYPEWGPYLYCADNPLKFIDPNGLWLDPANATKFVDAALSHEGTEYPPIVNGKIKRTEGKLDCSQLVGRALGDIAGQGIGTAAFDAFGTEPTTKDLWDAATQGENGLECIDLESGDLQTGDLLVWQISDGDRGNHVEIVQSVDTKNGTVNTVGSGTAIGQSGKSGVKQRPNMNPMKWQKLGKASIIRITEKPKFKEEAIRQP